MSDPMKKIQSLVNCQITSRDTVLVLDAGCGSVSKIDVGPAAYIVGIDIDQESLDRHTHLSEKILGDLQTYSLPRNNFDVIVCWQVLEHLSSPERALLSFVEAAKPDGLIVIDVPNVYSIKGLITKFTPHWFHVWVYQKVFKHPNAGQPNHPPYRTFMRRTIAPRRLRRFFNENGCSEEYFYMWPSIGTALKQNSLWAYQSYRVFQLFVSILTLGLYNGDASEVVTVVRKGQTSKK